MSATRDVPALLQVRNSKFIIHEQLFEFMKSGSYEYSRRSFNWRVKRLLDAGLIATVPGNQERGGAVYSITISGLLYLEDHGEFATVLNSTTEHRPHPAQMHHAIELNNIHLALVRSGVLAAWRSDVETASGNTVSTSPFGKDYDAVVDVWNVDTLTRFGLEYERTLKNARQYQKIRSALEHPDQVGCVLYLGSGSEVVLHLVHQFSGVSKRLAFATAQAFRQQLLDTPVIIGPHQPVTVFRNLLLGGMF